MALVFTEQYFLFQIIPTGAQFICGVNATMAKLYLKNVYMIPISNDSQCELSKCYMAWPLADTS